MPEILLCFVVLFLLPGAGFAALSLKLQKRNWVKVSYTRKVGTASVTTDYHGPVKDIKIIKTLHDGAVAAAKDGDACPKS